MPQEDDLLYEEELLRNPYSLNMWCRWDSSNMMFTEQQVLLQVAQQLSQGATVDGCSQPLNCAQNMNSAQAAVQHLLKEHHAPTPAAALSICTLCIALPTCTSLQVHCSACGCIRAAAASAL